MKKVLPQKALILGLGKSGVACAQFLSARGCELILADTRDQLSHAERLKQQYPEAVMHLGELSLELLEDIDALVISPGLDPRHPVVQAAYARSIDVLGDVELFARVVDKPVVAITGSNGKSTVTVLLGEMAKAAGLNVVVGGNLGRPAVELLDEQADAYVLELSSFQLETTSSLNPKAATILNLSPDHMDRYDDYADYVKAKARVFMGAECAIINADDAEVVSIACNLPSGIKPSHFSVDQSKNADYACDHSQLLVNGRPWMALGQMQLTGRHNVANALACVALAHAMGWREEGIKKALQTFPGLSHRMQPVLMHDGVQWINDSKATNVGATCAAVSGLESSYIVILGGVDKAQDFTELKEALVGRARLVVLIGDHVQSLLTALVGCIDLQRADSMLQAVQVARQYAQTGDTVLLSPACASFDWYSGFEARGDDFVSAVHQVCDANRKVNT